MPNGSHLVVTGSCAYRDRRLKPNFGVQLEFGGHTHGPEGHSNAVWAGNSFDVRHRVNVARGMGVEVSAAARGRRRSAACGQGRAPRGCAASPLPLTFLLCCLCCAGLRQRRPAYPGGAVFSRRWDTGAGGGGVPAARGRGERCAQDLRAVGSFFVLLWRHSAKHLQSKSTTAWARPCAAAKAEGVGTVRAKILAL